MKGSRGIVILDFGGQYAHLIARRVREAGAHSFILPPDTKASELKDVAGIILSGGPQSVYEQGSPQADPKIFDLKVPVLGLCYGHQWLAHALGGKVQSGKVKEYGHTEITVVDPSSALFKDLPEHLTVWMSHGDEVVDLPPGFLLTAKSADCVAGMADEKRKIYGMQFHMEVAHTQHGAEMLQKFVALCDAPRWSIEGYAKRVSGEIEKEVGDKNVFMLVSGGVDSTVAFTLLNSVLGPERVQGMLVDTGLMRKGEVAMIRDAFAKLKITNLHIEDASETFFTKLNGVTDPEQKRTIIGDTFLDVQKQVADRMQLKNGHWMLGQGTIYPDTIETGGTKHSDHIKTHHNRVDAIQKLIEKGLVLEPLKDLYKDEVRVLGEELGLPHDLVWRHPFPGPGLGVRILCTSEADIAKEQELPVFTGDVPHAVLPIRSVGVQGDGRTYRHAVAMFSTDPTTITPELQSLATSIPNTQHGFNRVLLCTSHNDPQTLVASPMTLTRERADLLREADAIVTEEMHKADLYAKIWQFPVVLLPVGIKRGGQSIVLRPVDSQEAMTATAYALPQQVIQNITERVLKLDGVEAVFVDLTNKPPATIEWE